MTVLAKMRDPELSAEKYETVRINWSFKIENYLQMIFTSKNSLRVWGSGAGPSFCWPLGDEVLTVCCWGWDVHLLGAVSWLISLHFLSSCCGWTTGTAGTCCRLYHRQQTEFLMFLRTIQGLNERRVPPPMSIIRCSVPTTTLHYPRPCWPQNPPLFSAVPTSRGHWYLVAPSWIKVCVREAKWGRCLRSWKQWWELRDLPGTCK